jgi:hypothetical protein
MRLIASRAGKLTMALSCLLIPIAYVLAVGAILNHRITMERLCALNAMLRSTGLCLTLQKRKSAINTNRHMRRRFRGGGRQG